MCSPSAAQPLFQGTRCFLRNQRAPPGGAGTLGGNGLAPVSSDGPRPASHRLVDPALGQGPPISPSQGWEKPLVPSLLAAPAARNPHPHTHPAAAQPRGLPLGAPGLGGELPGDPGPEGPRSVSPEHQAACSSPFPTPLFGRCQPTQQGGGGETALPRSQLLVKDPPLATPCHLLIANPPSPGSLGFPGGSVVKNAPPESGRFLPQEETAAHCSVLAGEIPRTEEPGGCSPRGRAESFTTSRPAPPPPASSALLSAWLSA